MDVVALGASTVLGTWGFEILQKILLECKGTLEVAEQNEPIDPQEEPRPDTNRLLLSRNPREALFNLLSGADLPVIGFIDHPVDAVRSVKQAHDCGTLDALRIVMESAAVIRTLERRRRVLIVDRDFAGGDARRIVASIATYLLTFYEGQGLEEFLARDDVSAVDEPIPMELELRNLVPAYLPLEESRRALSVDDVELIQASLGELSIWPGRAVSTRWPRSVFLLGDEADFSTRAVTEVTGVARILYYGPYFFLPASRYRVRVTLGFSAETAGTTFTLDGWDGELLGSARVRPSSAGIFVAAFDLEVGRPYRALEIRIQNDQGAIDGKIALVEVELVEWSIEAERERPQALAG